MKRTNEDQLVSLYVRLRDEKLVRSRPSRDARWPDPRFGPRLRSDCDVLTAGWNARHGSRWECVARERRRRIRASVRAVIGYDAGPHVDQWRPLMIIACFAATWIVAALALFVASNW